MERSELKPIDVLCWGLFLTLPFIPLCRHAPQLRPRTARPSLPPVSAVSEEEEDEQKVRTGGALHAWAAAICPELHVTAQSSSLAARLLQDLCVVCRGGDCDGLQWIQCDSCTGWVHFECDKRPGKKPFDHYNKREVRYTCPTCAPDAGSLELKNAKKVRPVGGSQQRSAAAAVGVATHSVAWAWGAHQRYASISKWLPDLNPSMCRSLI